jgi:PKHD-type hydroxylase
MIRIIQNVIDAETLASIREVLRDARFEDGKLTATGMARDVKNNQQLDGNAHSDIMTTLANTLLGNAEFAFYTRPVRITPLLVSKYEAGQAYGMHSDDAQIKGVRTDISFTLFLQEPEEYDGGELAIEKGYGQTRFKPQAGAVVIYPTGSLHQVLPVTRGVRLAAVGWVQSKIRDHAKREVIADLDLVRGEYLKNHAPDTLSAVLLKTSNNLQRLWMED